MEIKVDAGFCFTETKNTPRRRTAECLEAGSLNVVFPHRLYISTGYEYLGGAFCFTRALLASSLRRPSLRCVWVQERN